MAPGRGSLETGLREQDLSTEKQKIHPPVAGVHFRYDVAVKPDRRSVRPIGIASALDRPIHTFRAPRDGRYGKSCAGRTKRVKRWRACRAQAMSGTGW
jgi:hypothetical protein